MELQQTSYSSKNHLDKEVVYNSLLSPPGDFSDSDEDDEGTVGTHDSSDPVVDNENISDAKADVESFEFTEMQSPTWKKVSTFYLYTLLINTICYIYLYIYLYICSIKYAGFSKMEGSFGH